MTDDYKSTVLDLWLCLSLRWNKLFEPVIPYQPYRAQGGVGRTFLRCLLKEELLPISFCVSIIALRAFWKNLLLADLQKNLPFDSPLADRYSKMMMTTIMTKMMTMMTLLLQIDILSTAPPSWFSLCPPLLSWLTGLPAFGQHHSWWTRSDDVDEKIISQNQCQVHILKLEQIYTVLEIHEDLNGGHHHRQHHLHLWHRNNHLTFDKENDKNVNTQVCHWVCWKVRTKSSHRVVSRFVTYISISIMHSLMVTTPRPSQRNRPAIHRE